MEELVFLLPEIRLSAVRPVGSAFAVHKDVVGLFHEYSLLYLWAWFVCPFACHHQRGHGKTGTDL